MFLVNQAFIDDTECRNCTGLDYNSRRTETTMGILWSKLRKGSLEKLSADKCVSAYGAIIQSERRNLLVVTALGAFTGHQ
jgi:hypothetical protein